MGSPKPPSSGSVLDEEVESLFRHLHKALVLDMMYEELMELCLPEDTIPDTDIGPYKCEKCEKSCNDLLVHERTHHGRRLPACEWCGIAFAQAGLLRIHMRKHVTERPYACEYCEKAFVNHFYLLEHVRNHNRGFPWCVTCGLPFSTSQYRIAHMQSQTEERQQSREESGRFQSEIDHSRDQDRWEGVNSRDHTEERSFICEECGEVVTLLTSSKLLGEMGAVKCEDNSELAYDYNKSSD